MKTNTVKKTIAESPVGAITFRLPKKLTTIRQAEILSYCKKYSRSANLDMPSARLYAKITKRVLISGETLDSKRVRSPLIIIRLEGIIGYFDEIKYVFTLQKDAIQSLIQLS